MARIVFTLGFGFYVANFGNYDATYGTLGGVIVLMVWLYLSSFIMLVGAEVNAVLHARMQPESMTAPTAEPRRGAVATMRQERGR